MAQHKERMSAEFQKIGPNSARSADGFTVFWRPAGGIDFIYAGGTVRVDSEVLVNPARILIYPQSRDLRAMPGDVAELIVHNISKALEFLGHEYEIW
jgi:hypothetical protein